MNAQKRAGTPCIGILICALFLIMGPTPGLSDLVVGTPGTRPIPYDPGGTDDVPSAAARITNLASSPVPGGCRYLFDIEVFPTCWKPVYHFQINLLAGSTLEPASWPVGWVAEQIPSTLNSAGSIVFSNSDEPVQPGEILEGFALVSYSGTAAFRWYPADQDGILIGKISRVDLGCATATEPNTWGGIKAVYR